MLTMLFCLIYHWSHLYILYYVYFAFDTNVSCSSSRSKMYSDCMYCRWFPLRFPLMMRHNVNTKSILSVTVNVHVPIWRILPTFYVPYNTHFILIICTYDMFVKYPRWDNKGRSVRCKIAICIPITLPTKSYIVVIVVIQKVYLFRMAILCR